MVNKYRHSRPKNPKNPNRVNPAWIVFFAPIPNKMPNPTHMHQGCSSSISRASAVRLSSSRSLLLGFAASCFLGAPVEAQTIENPGFETPTLGANAFSYETQGSGWTLSPSAGISANGSGFTGANPSAPEGGQVLFLQGPGTAQRTITISPAQAGTYRIRLKAAQRNGNQQSVRIFLNGTQIDTEADFFPLKR